MSDAPNDEWIARTSRRRWAYEDSFGSWLPGIALIVVGVVFLAQSYFGLTLKNWWALFILIPAFGSFANAYEADRAGDRDHATGAVVAGLGFTVLCGAFLLDLDLGRLWPLALIAFGIALLVSRRGGSRWG